MRKLFRAAVAALFFAVCGSGAGASVLVSLAMSIAPVDLSGVWSQNAVNALRSGVSTYGTPGTATYFSGATTNAPSSSIVESEAFYSWNGNAGPSGAYASEHGNSAAVYGSVVGNGKQISASQLTFSSSSSDPGNVLGFDVDLGNMFYGTNQWGWTLWGIRYGADGKFGGSDDQLIISGSNDQLVDAIFYAGFGVSLQTGYCGGCDAVTGQAYLDAAAAGLAGPTTYAATVKAWDLSSTPGTGGGAGFRDLGSSTATLQLNGSAAPEPASLALVALALAAMVLIGFIRRAQARRVVEN